MRPSHPVQSQNKLTEVGTDLVTILRCFLSFKTVATSRNILVFKILSPAEKWLSESPTLLWASSDLLLQLVSASDDQTKALISDYGPAGAAGARATPPHPPEQQDRSTGLWAGESSK